MADTPIPLIQFWHSSEPPDDVARLMASWREDRRYAYRVHDARSAEALVERVGGPRAAAAFRACALPAMQSDLLRYAALLAHGGVWMDADQGNRGNGFETLLDCAPSGLLMSLQGAMASGVVFVREAGHPLMARLLDEAVANVESRRSNNVADVTGPMLLDRLLGERGGAALFRGFLIEDLLSIRRFVRFRWRMPYKDSDADWRSAAFEGRGSIYRDAS